jgi:soluble lytic murein transglycosylase-like protein
MQTKKTMTIFTLLNDVYGERVGHKSPLRQTLIGFVSSLAVILLLPGTALANTPYLQDNADVFLAKIEDSYGQMIDIAALLHDYDPKLIMAVIVVESEGKTSAVSNKGAKGLMQLMPGTAKAMGAVDPKDPFQNILAGTKYLKELEGRYRFKSPQEALVAYNMGPSRARRWLSQYDPDEYGYVQKVMYVYSVITQMEKDNARIAKSVSTQLASGSSTDSARPIMTKPRNISLASLPLSLSPLRRTDVVTEE